MATAASGMDINYEKYTKLAEAMNTNELQDVFIGRVDKLLQIVQKERDRSAMQTSVAKTKQERQAASYINAPLSESSGA